MRRPIITVVALVAAVSLMFVSTASALTNTVDFKANVKPYKLSTKKKKVGLELDVDFSIKNAAPEGGKPAALNKVTIQFPAGATANPKAFPTCDEDKLRSDGPTACSKAQIGTGTAIADASPLLPAVDAEMRVYNGKPKGGVPQIIFWATAKLVSVTLVFGGPLTKESGKYSYKLVVDVPHIPTLPGNPDAAVAEVHVKVQKKTTKTVKKKGKKVKQTINFIDSPSKCTTGGFPFHWNFGYWDGDPNEGDFTLPCP
jgi:hypothetical protein